MQNVSFVRGLKKPPFHREGSQTLEQNTWALPPGDAQDAVGGALSRVLEPGDLGMFLPT